MRIIVHRGDDPGPTTTVPTELMDGRLTYAALTVLLDLLGRPDEWIEADWHHTDPSCAPDLAEILRAIGELTEAGYYRVAREHAPDGTLRPRVRVRDTARPPLPGTGPTEPGPPAPLR
ncbi:hypothetical protein ACFRAR_33430 [Kitasatospora sp. NPDC056651]|uniref:hypothetical protein n=1 Tax=Kitasatospora sp. NPDC056651 TaxID=3345892 RepID=UPI0036C82627